MPDRSLRIACFEPWLGGSHRSFLEEWAKRSRHALDVHGLAPRHWKWRQEASAWELARRIPADRRPPDLLFCSDYVDLPRLIGFLPPAWRSVPTLAYFHENQLTYPVAEGVLPDHGPGFSNILTAIRADAVVFNSEFHRGEFGAAGDRLLRRLPSPNPRAALAAAVKGASVIAPAPDLEGIELGAGGAPHAPLRILFPHRLEADKDPVSFCAAVRESARAGAQLELLFTGQGQGTVRPDVAEALDGVAPWIAADSGHAPSREAFGALLRGADVVASTAHHEFFGIAFTEAMAAGCTPWAPRRQSYPGLLRDWTGEGRLGGLFDTQAELITGLIRLAAGRGWTRKKASRLRARAAVLPFTASSVVPALDDLAEEATTIMRHPQG